MDTSISLRVDASTGQRSGNNSPHGDRQSRRRQKLQSLLLSLRAGELDASRQAFTALVNFDPSVSADPYLSKIGAALQSSNLYAAQHFGHEIQNHGGQLRPIASDDHVVKKISTSKLRTTFTPGSVGSIFQLDQLHQQ